MTEQNNKYTEIIKQLNYKNIGGVLLRLFGVSKSFYCYKEEVKRYRCESCCSTEGKCFWNKEQNKLKMKTKKLLFGLIEMNSTFYNVLYTVLCIVILFIVLCGLACLCVEIDKNLNRECVSPLSGMTSSLVLYFLQRKLFAKNNYA